MPASPFDSALYRDLLGDADTARLFTDSAEIRAMLLVEGALARAQGAAGVIPETAAAAIDRAAMEVQIDPAALAAGTGQSAVSVPALVQAFREAMQAPEHAQYIHWGATSQDIMDTGLILRLRQVIALWEVGLRGALRDLGRLADEHAETPMAGRTYGQIASPTSFGAVVAAWGWPLLRHLERLEALKPRLLTVSLSGAAGTLSAMGESGPAVRGHMARALALSDPGRSWHSTRDGIAEFAGWMTLLTGSLGKLGEDLTLMSQSGQAEIRLARTGGSSTMPQKQNPVAPSLLVALARLCTALDHVVQDAQIHRQQRDGAAWFGEWLTLPQMCHATGRALALAGELAGGIRPDRGRMAGGLDGDGLGLIYAETLSFALARDLPRPEAQKVVKDLCRRAVAEDVPLPRLLSQAHPDRDWQALCTPRAQLGTAPQEARDFSAAAAAAAP